MGDRHFHVSSTHQDWIQYLGTLMVVAAVVVLAFAYRITGLNVPQTRVPFVGSIRQAAERARKENKPVLVDVSVASSFLSNKLDRDVHTRKDVAEAVEGGFIPLKLDPEHSTTAKKFCSKYGVSEYPTTLFLDPKGKEFHRIDGYVTGEEFLEELEVARTRAEEKLFLNVPLEGAPPRP